MQTHDSPPVMYDLLEEIWFIGSDNKSTQNYLIVIIHKYPDTYVT